MFHQETPEPEVLTDEMIMAIIDYHLTRAKVKNYSGKFELEMNLDERIIKPNTCYDDVGVYLPDASTQTVKLVSRKKIVECVQIFLNTHNKQCIITHGTCRKNYGLGFLEPIRERNVTIIMMIISN